ncbi:hypothetical protein KAR02_00650, partial [Candidatus Bipolaricaulota bacterium]|nr:hypothetical protein [Candidatus Bipolaricaulota bacterium]
KKPPAIVEFLERSLEAGETAVMAPRLELSSNALGAVDAISGVIGAYAAEAGQEFITGSLSIDTDWDSYILALERKGYTALEAIWNASWDQQKD